MKIFPVLIIACLVQLQATVYTYSQSTRFTIKMEDVTIREVFTEIERKSTFLFVYNNDMVALDKKVNINVKECTIENILDKLFENTDNSFEILNRQIVIKKREQNVYSSRYRNTSPFLNPRIVNGKVRESNGDPLPGVNIVVEGTTLGVTTDENGKYSIQVPYEKDVLVFSYVGYNTQKISVLKIDTSEVILIPDIKSLDEVIVVGYGMQNKTSSTAAVSTIKARGIAFKPNVNLTNSITGRTSGIIVTQSSGEPGYDGASIRIRGTSTTGNAEPLIIVDGIYRDFSHLDPNTIESFSILKDAAAVAPYGLAGANGVILATTKSGKPGKTTLSYNTYVGIQNPTRLLDQVNSYQYVLMKNEAAQNEGLPIPYAPEVVNEFKKTVEGASDSDPDKYPNSHPVRDIIEKNRILTYHNLELSGGSENLKYYTALGYTYQQGQWSTTHLKKYNLIVKLEAKATRLTNISLTLNGNIENRHFPGTDAGGIMYQALRTPPISAVYYSNGLWGQYVGRSLVGYVYHSGYTREARAAVMTNLSIEQQLPFLKGLNIKAVLSYDPKLDYIKRWSTPIPVYNLNLASEKPYTFDLGYLNAGKPGLGELSEITQAITYQGFINYHNTFGNHDITVLGVIESRNRLYHRMDARRINFNLNIDELDAGSTTANDISNGGSSAEERQIGYVYRIGYGFAGKYLAELAGRYDGHYYFAPGKRFGFFPSFSLGWKISEENFIKDNLLWVDLLKIRSSYGESGNLAGRPFQYLNAYQLGPGGSFNNIPTQGVHETDQANPDITWEKAKKFDLGIELKVLHSISLEIDYFYEIRSNMLVTPQVTVPLEYGQNLTQVNAGVMDNRGIEILLELNHRFENDLKIGFSANTTYAVNKLLEVFETPATYNNPNRRKTGRSKDTQFGYKALGFFQVADFNSDGSLKTGIATQPWEQVQPGDIRYADLNKDGKIDESDQTVIGNPMIPQLQFGFMPAISFKGFDLNALFQGAAKSNILLSETTVWPFANSGSATVAQFNNHWTPSNPNAKYARLTSESTTNNRQSSSWWIRNNSYIRLKSIEVGYSFSSKLTQYINVQMIRVYFSGLNLWTKTPKMQEVIDPEATETTGKYYFQQSVYSLGLNVTF